MFFRKNKTLISMAAFAVLFLGFGISLIFNLYGVSARESTDSIMTATEQGASAISFEISGGLESLNALSNQKAFSGAAASADLVPALSREVEKHNFHSAIYSDPSGSGISDTGEHLSVADEPYFIQAMKGTPSISCPQKKTGAAGEIVLATPVLRGDSISGVLIASLNGIDQSRLTGSVVNEAPDYLCILKKDGAIVTGNFSGEKSCFFSLVQPDGHRDNRNKIKTDFQNGTSGTSTLKIEDSSVVAAYSHIKGTDGWMFLTADHYSRIFARFNKLLFPSALLFLILTAALFLALFYFHKLKKLNHEAKIRNEEQKKYFTFFDPLTNLPNRKGIIREFGGWVEKCRKDSRSGGVLFLDIDNLRSMNNTFGHDSGDKLLCESAARLKKAVGGQDLVGRTGSDEFIVLVHGLNTENSLEFFAKKIVRIFREPFLVNGIVIQLSCSVGALLFPHQKENQQFEDILGRGEFILNKAKQTRKGSYLLFNEDYGNLIDRQLRLERALKFSIENQELACYFQPQYDCLTKTITGFETLARWKNSEFGMISPVQFIPMAEKSGFIKEIGHHVIEEAFSFAKSMEDRKVTVSFNASPMELLEANYADYIISRFQYYGLAPYSVAIEVTESCLIESFEKVAKKLQMLKRHGILIYLDDFGTGFSSLTYLKNLPINAVKIDKSFIDEIVTKDIEKDIVRMIIKLAYRLNLEVIAEGVETEDQIRCISEAGCHLVQGYFISRPVPQEEVPSLFEEEEKQKAGKENTEPNLQIPALPQ